MRRKRTKRTNVAAAYNIHGGFVFLPISRIVGSSRIGLETTETKTKCGRSPSRTARRVCILFQTNPVVVPRYFIIYDLPVSGETIKIRYWHRFDRASCVTDKRPRWAARVTMRRRNMRP
jgi:hypothetical protein